MHPETSVAGHLLGILLSLRNSQMVPKLQVATACLSCRPPGLNLSKLPPCCGIHQIANISKLSLQRILIGKL
jgi:hypothetical protein